MPTVAGNAFKEPKKTQILQRISKNTAAAELPKKFKLLVWNILTGHKEKWTSTFKDYQKNHQLILLQETYLTEAQKNIYKDSDLSWDLGNAYLYVKNGVMSGVATGSVARSTEQSYLFSKYKEPIMDVKKITLFSTFRVRGVKKSLLVVNVHAINFVFDHIYFEQLSNIEIKLRNHKGPLILAGDFNSFNLAKLKFLRMIAEKHGLKEVEFKLDRRKSFNSFPLDHVFVRGFGVLNSEVFDSSVASDHNAISVELEVQDGK